jgi:hypothetical protein
MRDRPKLLPITDQMKEWSAHLDRTISSWSGVTCKPMFGMISFYRDGTIFAAIPRTKSFEPENSIAFKLNDISSTMKVRLHQDGRIALGPGKMAGWITFAIREASDLNGALQWMETAYAGAKKPLRRVK